MKERDQQRDKILKVGSAASPDSRCASTQPLLVSQLSPYLLQPSSPAPAQPLIPIHRSCSTAGWCHCRFLHAAYPRTSRDIENRRGDQNSSCKLNAIERIWCQAKVYCRVHTNFTVRSFNTNQKCLSHEFDSLKDFKMSTKAAKVHRILTKVSPMKRKFYEA